METRKVIKINEKSLTLQLPLFLRQRLQLLHRLPRRLTLQLIRSPLSNILGPEITEEPLKHILNDPATAVVEDHENCQRSFEFHAEGNEAQFFVHFGDELGGAGEGHARCGHKTPVHGFVFADGLAEGTALVVDGEG